MTRRLSCPSRSRLGVVAAVTAACVFLGLVAPVARAATGRPGGGVTPVRMYGYAKGPAQKYGTAAGRPHHVSASATRARGAGGVKGHRAPKLAALPAPVGTRTLVRVGVARMPSGHLVTGRRTGDHRTGRRLTGRRLTSSRTSGSAS